MPINFQAYDPWEAANRGLQFGTNLISLPGQLKQQQLANAFNEFKNQYAPLTLQADAASKLAYANLMGPQFLAKLMGNQDILANVPESKLPIAISQLLKAGMGNSNGPEFQESNGQSLFNPHVKRILQNQPESRPDMKRQSNVVRLDMSQFLPEEQQTINSMQPGNEYIYRPNEQQSTFAEKSANYQTIKEQGKETGKQIAKDIADLGKQAIANASLSDKYNALTNMVNDPIFRNMRKDVPFFQAKQLWLKSKTGTPEEQELVGNFENTAEGVIADTLKTFPAGRILVKEVDIARNMKISPNDTLNVMIGKLKAAMTYKELNQKRMDLTANIMEGQHISMKKALTIADKQLNSQSIINDIDKRLDYEIQVISNKTGEKKMMKISEARAKKIRGNY